MCIHCETKGMVAIDETLLDILIIKSGIKPEDLQNLITKAVKDDKLTFKPDKQMGEGTATKEELKYRADLLKLAEKLHDKISKIINSDKKPLDKTNQIDQLIESFITDGQKLIQETIPQTWNDSIKDGIAELKRLKKDETYDSKKVDTTKKDLILQQQLHNLEDIALKLRGRLRQFILINAIQTNDAPSTSKKSITKAIDTSKWTQCMKKLHEQEPTLTEDELRERCEGWETSFNEAETNLDKMGLFGWLTANHMAFYSTLLYGAVIVGELIADWVTMGDDRVCDECLENEANSPYSIFDKIWTIIVHFGCRCWMDNIRLATETRDEIL